MVKKKKALFLDADYSVNDNKTYARLLVKGKKRTRLLFQYDPYFYADAVGKKDVVAELKVKKHGESISVKKVEVVTKIVDGKEKELLKIYCNKPADVVALRESVPFKCYEHRIHYGRRFMLDFGIRPFSIIHYEREGNIISKIRKVDEENNRIKLDKIAFDIEVYNPLGAPREKKDPAIMISYFGEKKGVITYKQAKKSFVHVCKNESEMITGFENKIAELDPDVIYGYNSGNFDLPYLKARADVLKIKLALGKGGKSFRMIRKGMISGAKIPGRIHLDLYPAVRFFGFIGMVKAQVFTLENIYAEITGKKKKMVQRLAIWEMWDKGDLEELAEYSLGDSEVTYELGEHIYPLLEELSKITRMPLFDTGLATSGQLVESLLMSESVPRNEIIPPRPSGGEAMERQKNPIEGAFVKLPDPGIYDNIAVFDFRGLYPSIIISYNIDPFRLLEKGKHGDSFESPTGARFMKKPKGLIPFTLESLLDLRAGIKKTLKEMSKGSEKYKKAYARSHALKILANSFYGYLGYARSRWYSRECAESVTAWGRMHILDAAKKAENAGFKVLYADTDSLFLLLGDKGKKHALAFLESINKNLPEKMELELENFYTRGVFVSKKQEEKGAKKKYAMLAEDGSIKIRGFELVRRDWSKIAKDTQYLVLEIILKEGDKDKAIKVVKETIKKLKEGKAALSDLIIYTQLTKHPKNYEIINPEVAAARKAVAKGVPLEKGSIVPYVIGRSGKSISDKAEYADYAKDYDPDYYINNQVLPAVMKILKELGCDEDELKNKGKQKSLNHFLE
ncbi:DNA-directed DNA polymerase [Candidatus Micrarchaeota archaeon]|nr:DNA-directed DNA polymerase [Candidatus Micrarchaeota archaeon]